MRLFGILLLVFILLAGGGYVYLASQDYKGRQQINAAALRHVLLVQGLPLEGEDFNTEDETPFEVLMAGGESTKTVSKNLLEKYFADNTTAGAGPAAATPGVEPTTVPRAALSTTAAVTNQTAEVKRVFALLKADLDKATTPTQKIALVEGWLLIQAESMNERIRYQALISPTVPNADKIDVAKTPEQLAADADELAHALDRRFYRVMPKLYESPDAALAPAKWQAVQKQIAEADPAAADQLKLPVSTDAADRRAKLAHLLVHLDRDAAWQKRVAVIVGLRRYAPAVATQAVRFVLMRNQVDLPIAADQATFHQNQIFLINEARQKGERARATAYERAKLVEQKTAADSDVSRRQTQLDDLKAQLQKVRTEVDELLVRQTGIEKQLYEIQREVGLTLEEVYRLEALLIDVERERYALPPRTRP